MMAAVMDEIKTAPAAISFVNPAFGLGSGETRSVRTSMAELKISAVKTKPMQNIIINHSTVFILRKSPNPITKTIIAM